MNAAGRRSRLEECRRHLARLAGEHGLQDEAVTVLARPLTPEEAIGTPGRRDYPIVVGKERVIEAQVREGRGQAFTDEAREFLGTLGDVLALPLDRNGNRAIFIASLNAVLADLGIVEGTVHCRDEEPEQCAREIAAAVQAAPAPRLVGLIGLNPAIAEALIAVFGADRVRITDLSPDQVGRRRGGVEVGDGHTGTSELIAAADLVLVTGTTLVNDTFDPIWEELTARGKRGLVYGVTAAGVCHLLDLPRICPCAGAGRRPRVS